MRHAPHTLERAESKTLPESPVMTYKGQMTGKHITSLSCALGAFLVLGGCVVVPVVGVLGAGETAHRVGEERGWIEPAKSPIESICTETGLDGCAAFDVDVPGVR